eukprot:5798379-Prymnesium_polylepis.1
MEVACAEASRVGLTSFAPMPPMPPIGSPSAPPLREPPAPATSRPPKSPTGIAGAGAGAGGIAGATGLMPAPGESPTTAIDAKIPGSCGAGGLACAAKAPGSALGGVPAAPSIGITAGTAAAPCRMR